MPTNPSVTVVVDGQTLVVDAPVNGAGDTMAFYTDPDLTEENAVTFPATITEDTTWYAPGAPFGLDIALVDGTLLWSSTVHPQPADPAVISPVPSTLQVSLTAQAALAAATAPADTGDGGGA
jgi:hypothetical protein